MPDIQPDSVRLWEGNLDSMTQVPSSDTTYLNRALLKAVTRRTKAFSRAPLVDLTITETALSRKGDAPPLQELA